LGRVIKARAVPTRDHPTGFQVFSPVLRRISYQSLNFFSLIVKEPDIFAATHIMQLTKITRYFIDK
jgi:hypothetical protein